MSLNEVHFIYLFILFSISIGTVFLEVYRTVKSKRTLGQFKYRVITRTRNFRIFILIVTFIIFIFFVIEYMGRYLETSGSLSTAYAVRATYSALVSIISFSHIISSIRSHEIREKGISSSGKVFIWKDIQYYKIVDESIVAIFTNKKKVFSKGNKIIKWDVEEKRFNTLVSVLNKHIKEYGSATIN